MATANGSRASKTAAAKAYVPLHYAYKAAEIAKDEGRQQVLEVMEIGDEVVIESGGEPHTVKIQSQGKVQYSFPALVQELKRRGLWASVVEETIDAKKLNAQMELDEELRRFVVTKCTKIVPVVKVD